MIIWSVWLISCLLFDGFSLGILLRVLLYRENGNNAVFSNWNWWEFLPKICLEMETFQMCLDQYEYQSLLNGSCRNLLWFCFTWDQSRTGWNWDSKNFKRIKTMICRRHFLKWTCRMNHMDFYMIRLMERGRKCFLWNC